MTLTEADGRSTLTILVEHTSQEDRDAHISSGMEEGLQDALDLLEEVAGIAPPTTKPPLHALVA